MEPIQEHTGITLDEVDDDSAVPALRVSVDDTRRTGAGLTNALHVIEQAVSASKVNACES
jgi:hypothetical protein